MTGFGYSLVYPGFGVEAVRRAPQTAQGLAMGAFMAFLDLALGIASPMLGFIKGVAGLGSTSVVSAVSACCAAAVALRLQRFTSARRSS